MYIHLVTKPQNNMNEKQTYLKGEIEPRSELEIFISFSQQLIELDKKKSKINSLWTIDLNIKAERNYKAFIIKHRKTSL